MPIGVIVNCLAVLFGGLFGAAAGNYIPQRTENALTVAFGLASFAIGITSIVQYSSTSPVVLAVIAGTGLGSLLLLEKRIEGGFRRLLDALPLNRNAFDMDRYITVVVIFCSSGFGIFGTLTEGMTGDPSLLISKAILDFFTAFIFAGALGLSVSVIALPQLFIFLLLFFSAKGLAPMISDTAMQNFIACGGILTMGAGLRVARIQNVPIGDMIPALALVVPFTYLWEMLPF